MHKNTGTAFEDKVFNIITDLVQSNEFIVGEPYVRVLRKAKYYSRDRDSYIQFEIAVEKYLKNPDIEKSLRPAIIVVVECKDYISSVPIDDVEEFHAKLQQVGADNTKGIIITRTGAFQKSALKYALSKGITLARILPDDQVHYILFKMPGMNFSRLFDSQKNAIRALTEKDYVSENNEYFFSITGDESLDELLCNMIK